MRSNAPASFVNLMTKPTAKVTIERWLPKWTQISTGTTAPSGSYFGHAAAISGNVILRARYKATGGVEYLSIDLASPVWTAGWTAIGSSDRKPMWASSDYGAMMDIVVKGDGSFRLFYFANSTKVSYHDFTSAGVPTGSNVILTYTATGSYSRQLSAVDESTVYVAENVITADPVPVPLNPPALISDRLRTVVRKVTNGAVSDDVSKYPAYNIEGGLYRDDFIKKINGTGFTDVDQANTAATETIARWGYRPNGGLKVTSTNLGVTAIYAGTFWNRYKFKSHSHGLHLFAEYDDGWRKLRDIGTADYDDDTRLFYDAHVSGTGNIVTWLGVTEPGYFNQYNDSISIPRVVEVVAAKLNDTGEYLSEPITIGGLKYVGARILEASDGTLYCLGYEAIQSSPPASVFSTVNTDSLDISDYISKFTVQSTARITASLDVTMTLTQATLNDGRFEPGNRLNIFIGDGTNPTFKLGSARIGAITPSIRPNAHTATIRASFDDVLGGTFISQMDDILPEAILNDIVPAQGDELAMRHIGFSNGNWGVAPDPEIWDDAFCGSNYGMNGKNTIRLSSAPWAYTGGTNTNEYDLPTTEKEENGPGKVLDRYHPQDKGTWAKDILWLSSPSSTDGFIKLTTRFGFTQNKIVGGSYNSGTKEYEDLTVPSTGNIYIDGMDKIKRYDGKSVDYTLKMNPITGSVGVINKLSEKSDGTITTEPQQWALATGIIFHAQDIGQKYIFAWEASIPPMNASHIDDETKVKENFGEIDYSTYTGNNKLVIIATDNNSDDDEKRTVSSFDGIGTTPLGTATVDGKYITIDNTVLDSVDATSTLGKPMDMMVRSVNGKIECYSRPTKTNGNANSNWVHAFTLDSTRFGAGRIGIYGRGGMGVQWDTLWAERDIIAQLINKVDFWDIESSDTSENYTIEDVLRFVTWKARVKAKFLNIGEATLSTAGTLMLANPQDSTATATINQVVIGEALGNASNSSSVLMRSAQSVTPQDYLEIKFTNGQVEKTVYLGGAAQPSTKDSYPFPTNIDSTKKFVYKITAIDNKYTIWMNNSYVGFFTEDTELGVYTAIKSTGAYITARIPELYEVPQYTTLDTGQSVLAVLKSVIGKRKVKAIPQFDDESILFTYATYHEDAGVFHDGLIQNDLTISSKVISRATVEGAYAKATFVSDAMLEYTTASAIVSQPDIYLTEHCYREAMAIVQESMERRIQCSLIGTPRPQVEAEDKINIQVDGQSINGDHIVDDVVFTYTGGNSPSFMMSLSTRQMGVI